jgi:cystathionine beta-lyase
MKNDFDKIHERLTSHSMKYKEKQAKDDFIPLCVSDMDFKSPSKVTEAISLKIKDAINGYTYLDDRFYASVISWMLKRHDWLIAKDHIIHSVSVMASIRACIECFSNVGDKIVVLSPEYHEFYTLIEQSNRHISECPLVQHEGEYFIDYEKFIASLCYRTRMLILSSPHNPIGKVWSKQELKLIGDICRKKHVIIISDEIHSDLVYAPYKHVPIASLSSDISDITITLNSPSKAFNLMGTTLSYAISSNPIFLRKLQKQLNISRYDKINTITNTTLPLVYKEEKWLENLVNYLHGNIALMQELFTKHESKITFIAPQASYLIWLDFNELGLSHDEIKKRLKKVAKVGLCNGKEFSQTLGSGFFRLNIALPKQKLENAVLRIIEAFKI